MATWKTVTKQNPCPICGKTDWCAVSGDGTYATCRRIDTGKGKLKIDKQGGEYWVYKLKESEELAASTKTLKVEAQFAPLTSSRLDTVYQQLLSMLPLVIEDLNALEKRGLSYEEIFRRQYKTLPFKGRSRIAKSLVDRYGEDICKRVPGLFFKESGENGYWTIARFEGILIPLRNIENDIIALKVRRKDSRDPKYLYLSSNGRGGLGPGSPVHVPLHSIPDLSIVRLTEGELKADIATVLSGILTISIAGISTWKSAIPVLKDLGAKTCRLAFDMDVYQNYHVANALKQTALELIVEGFGLEFEFWNPEYKGIDDCLRAGANIDILSGGSGYTEVAKIFKKVRRDWRRSNILKRRKPT